MAVFWHADLVDDKGAMHKPVIMSHHMLGALDGDDKMSKSKPDSAIFMEDTEAEVVRKIKKSFWQVTRGPRRTPRRRRRFGRPRATRLAATLAVPLPRAPRPAPRAPRPPRLIWPWRL